MVHVKKLIQRPSADIVAGFSKHASATVHEAYGRKGAVDNAIKPIAPGVRICGPAFTVACAPRDNLMLHKALERAEPGDILVTTVSGFYNAGYWGGLMATSAMARGLGGLAIDGCLRDSAELIEMGFKAFCRGSCIQGTVKAVLGLVNHPVVFGGLLVNPGDLILGDDDGIVVVERESCERVLEATEKRVAAEVKKAAELSKGVTSVTLNKLDPIFQNLGLVEEK